MYGQLHQRTWSRYCCGCFNGGVRRRLLAVFVASFVFLAGHVAVAFDKDHNHGSNRHASASSSPNSSNLSNVHRTLKPRPRVLLWIPVHITESMANVEAMARCTFTRHRPSLTGEAFDVLITLSGNVSNGKEPVLARVMRQATAHIAPVRPTVHVEFLHLSKDRYDNGHSKGGDSSYAGPNTVFYSLMLGDDDNAVTHAVLPPPPNSTALHRQYIAPYSFVQILETDCCALRDGWLDVLMKPMLAHPHVLISGSRPRAACFTAEDDSSCPSRIPKYVRKHINGNAMYRTGSSLRAILLEARDEMLDLAPFDLAMYIVGKDDKSHVYDNTHVYSVAAPVDATLWDDAAYYGLEQNAVLAHVPRRMRKDGILSLRERLGSERPVAVVVVAPTIPTASLTAHDQGGRNAHVAATAKASKRTLSVDVPLLRNCHASMKAATADRDLIYIALTRSAFVEASRVAPFRVLLVSGAVEKEYKGLPAPHPSSLAVHALNATAALARSGVDMLVMGTDAVVVKAGFLDDLLTMNVQAKDERGEMWPTLRLLQSPSGAAPLMWLPSYVSPDRTFLDAGMMYVPRGNATAAFLEHWAAGLAKEKIAENRSGDDSLHPVPSSSSWTKAATIMAAAAACKERWWTDCPWRGVNLSVDWLPPEAYASGDSYWGPAWSDAARREAASVVAVGVAMAGSLRPVTSPPEFRLRQAGLWYDPPATGCANYSAVSRKPVKLGPDVLSVHRALARHAAFIARASAHRIACAILPGFHITSTGNTVPYDSVLRADVLAGLADGVGSVAILRSPPIRFFPSAASLDVPYDSFIDLATPGSRSRPGQSVGAGSRQPWRRSQPRTGIEENLTRQRHAFTDELAATSAAHATVPMARAWPVLTSVSLPTTPTQNQHEVGLPPYAAAITRTDADSTSTAAAAYACSVLGLAGTSCFSPEVAAAINAAATALPAVFWCVSDPGRSTAEAATLALEGRLHEVDAAVERIVGVQDDALTILLTGAAWRATAAARAAGDKSSSVITLADLPGIVPSDPIMEFVRPDTAAPLSSAAASPWADVIEYALCQASAGVRYLPASGVHGLLVPQGTAVSTLLPRVAARIPPSLLQEDLDALSTWLARPDRPGLGGPWVRTRWARRQSDTHLRENLHPTGPSSLVSPRQGAGMLTATVRKLHALRVPLGFVPGLPLTNAPTCAGKCWPASWASIFGTPIRREMYGRTHFQLLPPTAAVLMMPDASLDAFRWDGLPVVMNGSSFPASASQLNDPQRALVVAVVRRALDSRSIPCDMKQVGVSSCHAPRTMWMNYSLPVDRLGRLKHFVSKGGTIVLEGRLET